MRPRNADSTAEQKRALRSELIAVRARLSQDDRQERSRAIAERLDAVEAFRTATTVALYSPLGTEVDSGPIARQALSHGARVVYPRVVRGERRLAFARCDQSDLAPGPLGAAEPPPGAPEVPLGEIGCVVMPGVAFSEEGARLGRGGGYYDATLRRIPAAARIGVAYDVQIVPTLPHEDHDQALDAVVTDARTLQFARNRS